MNKQTLVFAVAGYNLAETGRMIEIARSAKQLFDVRFISYGGQFERLIEEEGFSLTRMEPRLTQEKLDRLRVVLSGETLNTIGYFSAKELSPVVITCAELRSECINRLHSTCLPFDCC